MTTDKSRAISELEQRMKPLAFQPPPSELARWKAADEARLRRAARAQEENTRAWAEYFRRLQATYTSLAEEAGCRAEALEASLA